MIRCFIHLWKTKFFTKAIITSPTGKSIFVKTENHKLKVSENLKTILEKWNKIEVSDFHEDLTKEQMQELKQISI